MVDYSHRVQGDYSGRRVDFENEPTTIAFEKGEEAGGYTKWNVSSDKIYGNQSSFYCKNTHVPLAIGLMSESSRRTGDYYTYTTTDDDGRTRTHYVYEDMITRFHFVSRE